MYTSLMTIVALADSDNDRNESEDDSSDESEYDSSDSSDFGTVPAGVASASGTTYKNKRRKRRTWNVVETRVVGGRVVPLVWEKQMVVVDGGAQAAKRPKKQHGATKHKSGRRRRRRPAGVSTAGKRTHGQVGASHHMVRDKNWRARMGKNSSGYRYVFKSANLGAVSLVHVLRIQRLFCAVD